MAQRGRLITIEGIDGAGKSTLSLPLAVALQERGLDLILLREPGGVALSEKIRDLVKDPELTIGPAAEALLYAAARAQLVAERIAPALEAGQWVLLDRFVDSSLAYQGAGRGLGMEAVRAINALATNGLVPDRTLLLRIAPAVGRARQSDRGEEADRLELEADAFFQTIARAYDMLAVSEPERIVPISAILPPEQVLVRALRALEDLVEAPA